MSDGAGDGRSRPVLEVRALRPGEPPSPGDVFFSHSRRLGAAVIRFGTLSRTNHAGVIVDAADPRRWDVVEAQSGGVQLSKAINPKKATVLRVSDSADVRQQVVEVALSQAHQKPRIRYDYETIGMFVVRGVCFFPATVVVFFAPRLAKARAWYPVFLPSLFAGFATKSLYSGVFRHLHKDNPGAFICSEQVRRCLEAVFGTPALGFGDLRHWETSPGDLLQALMGRRDWEMADAPVTVAPQTIGPLEVR